MLDTLCESDSFSFCSLRMSSQNKNNRVKRNLYFHTYTITHTHTFSGYTEWWWKISHIEHFEIYCHLLKSVEHKAAIVVFSDVICMWATPLLSGSFGIRPTVELIIRMWNVFVPTVWTRIEWIFTLRLHPLDISAAMRYCQFKLVPEHTIWFWKWREKPEKNNAMPIWW